MLPLGQLAARRGDRPVELAPGGRAVEAPDEVDRAVDRERRRVGPRDRQVRWAVPDPEAHDRARLIVDGPELAALDGAGRTVRVAAAVDPQEVADQGGAGVGLGPHELRLRLPGRQLAPGVERRLPNRADRTGTVVAADQEQAVTGDGDCGPGPWRGQGQGELRLVGGLPRPERPGRRVDGRHVRARGRRTVGIAAAEHEDLPAEECGSLIRERLGQRRAFGPRGEVAVRIECRHEHLVTGGGAVRAPDVEQLRARDDRRPVPSRRRQGQLRGRGLPGQDGPGRGRTGERAVLGRAEIDRRPGEDAQVDRREDGEVVGPVRDVAEHDDDDDEPEERLQRGPRPAVCVEQPEQHAPPRRGS